MKHNLKITLFLLALFIITQFIGMFVVNHYASPDNLLPYGMETPPVESETDFYTSFLPSIILAFVIAIFLLILLTKFKLAFILRLWFFLVVTLAIGIFFNTILPIGNYTGLIAVIFALPLALIKVYKQNFFIHNLTELVIYPSIGAVFVPLLNIWTAILLLVLISIYDMWAVWKSGLMQKMAKYQMNELKVFGGLMVPYLSKSQKVKLKKMRALKKQDPKKFEKNHKEGKMKVNMAILGGGDVVFPIITSGVMLVNYGFWPALFVILGATLGLSYLLFFASPKKFYPAMPFITAGIFLGMLASLPWIL
jgi:presenilin-like A22 family membrane protease